MSSPDSDAPTAADADAVILPSYHPSLGPATPQPPILTGLLPLQIRNKRLARLQAQQQQRPSAEPTPPLSDASSEVAPKAAAVPQNRPESRLLSSHATTKPEAAPTPSLKRAASPGPSSRTIRTAPAAAGTGTGAGAQLKQLLAPDGGLTPQEAWEDQKLGQIFRVALRVCVLHPSCLVWTPHVAGKV